MKNKETLFVGELRCITHEGWFYDFSVCSEWQNHVICTKGQTLSKISHECFIVLHKVVDWNPGAGWKNECRVVLTSRGLKVMCEADIISQRRL